MNIPSEYCIPELISAKEYVLEHNNCVSNVIVIINEDGPVRHYISLDIMNALQTMVYKKGWVTHRYASDLRYIRYEVDLCFRFIMQRFGSFPAIPSKLTIMKSNGTKVIGI